MEIAWVKTVHLQILDRAMNFMHPRRSKVRILLPVHIFVRLLTLRDGLTVNSRVLDPLFIEYGGMLQALVCQAIILAIMPEGQGA